jgi:protease I
MASNLSGKRVAFILTNGVEQAELTEPREALKNAGAVTEIVSPEKDEVQAMQFKERGARFKVDISLNSADPRSYDALVIPGGVMNPDELRTIPEAVRFVKSFFDSHKPVAAICHGLWMLVEADVAHGRTLTSWPSLKTDLRNAGANWVDREVVQDGLLTTGRKPDDLPAFNQKMLESFAENTEHQQATAF